jgi:hypothetical protein
MPQTYILAIPLDGPTPTTVPLAVSYAVRFARVPGTGDGREGDDHDFMAGEPSAQKRNAR